MPANGTAGLARSAGSGISRFPSPPASTIANTFGRFPVMLATLAIISPAVSSASHGYRRRVRVDVLTKEYPPEVYGGAGVHVAELVRALRARDDLTTRVQAFGAARDEEGTASYADLAELADVNGAIKPLGVDLAIADACAGTDLVHSHTWYANMAGHLAGLLHGIPHVVSAHSLEPLRPWKAEQLGGGYAVSSWVERTAYEAAAGIIAVSDAMRPDVLHASPAVDPARVQVVHNGIDTELWSPVHDPDRVRSLGVEPDRPSVVFVGRVTRE